MTHITFERETLEQVLDDLYAGGYHRSRALRVLDAALQSQAHSTVLEEQEPAIVAEPVAWQNKDKPSELVATEDWDNIDPIWHWMYRPLYVTPPAAPVSWIDELQVAEALRQYGLTLVKTSPGYTVLKLGQIDADGITKGQE